ncbi:MAG: AAA family ATPase, partial [Candidatus Riesia sp.]|nr:AAA family ATPase [Candidatus Riesia sp.]
MSSSPFGSFDPGLLQQLQSMAQPDPYASSSRKFQNGDRVVISESSRYFGQGDTEGVPGVIMAYHSCNGIYAVEFANGYRDSYSPGELEPYNEKQSKQAAHVTLDSVILAKDKKEQIKAAISQEENNDIIFNEWGFGEVFEKGTAISLLFWGIPGTGKTLMAQAIADTLGKTLKVYGPAEIQSSEPGGSERTIKAIFADAKRNTDTVILFDECDSLLYDRNEIGPILAQQVNALLSEIETFSGIVIFTTNRMGKLDPALERRITAKVEFPFPDKAERKLIWERLLPKKAPLDKDV